MGTSSGVVVASHSRAISMRLFHISVVSE